MCRRRSRDVRDWSQNVRLRCIRKRDVNPAVIFATTTVDVHDWAIVDALFRSRRRPCPLQVCVDLGGDFVVSERVIRAKQAIAIDVEFNRAGMAVQNRIAVVMWRGGVRVRVAIS